MVHEGLLPGSPHATQDQGIESHLHKYVLSSKFSKYGLPLPLSTPEKAKQSFKSRHK